MVSWKKMDITVIEKFCNDEYDRYEEYPSIRDIFYSFVDELWPNTLSVYQGLCRWLVEMRFEGKIDWRIMRDGGGRELSFGDYSYRTPQESFENSLHSFKNCASRYSLPKWHRQPNKVVVLCEKEADYPIVRSILSDLNVNVGYMKGFSGKRIMFEIVEEFNDSGKVPHIIVLGDFDPSGSGEGGIKENVKNDLAKLGIDIEPIDIAVTKEQIEMFKLPHKPEAAKEIEKLRNDPRFQKWPYGLYRVETAALRNKQPDYFRKLLRETVQKLFDQKIHDDNQPEELEGQMKIKEMVENVLKEDEENDNE